MVYPSFFFQIALISGTFRNIRNALQTDHEIDGEILELTPLTYTQKLAALFPDKPFGRIVEVLGGTGVV